MTNFVMENVFQKFILLKKFKMLMFNKKSTMHKNSESEKHLTGDRNQKVK